VRSGPAAVSGAALFSLERSPVVGVLIVMVSAFRGVEVRFRSWSEPSEAHATSYSGHFLT
jgi:hypothetical protein